MMAFTGDDGSLHVILLGTRMEHSNGTEDQDLLIAQTDIQHPGVLEISTV